MMATVPVKMRVLEHLPPGVGWPPKHLVAADIETKGLGGPYLLGATLDDKGNYVEHETEGALFDYFIAHYKGGELLLHNADYDMRYIIPHIERLAKKGYDTELCVDARERITYVTIHHPSGRGRWRIRDTYALLPLPLAELAPLAGMQKEDIGLADGVIFDPWDDTHRRYLKRDVEMLLAAYQSYCRTLKSQFGIMPGYTSGGTALRAFRRTLTPRRGIFRQRPKVEAVAREAYFGGLSWYLDAKPHLDVVKLDVNAMYATAMRQGVPTGSGARVYHEVPGKAAIYRAVVTPPDDCPFPFVPTYVEGKGTQYPLTRFETTLCSHTMETARAHGYTVDVIMGYVFDRVEMLFDDFVAQCEKLELEYARYGVKIIVKQMRNSLCGKFGQRPDGYDYTITTNPTGRMTPVMNFLDGLVIGDLYRTKEHREQPHLHPLFAAWITASARNMLAQAVYELGPSECYYGDTDSVVVPQSAVQKLSVGPRYGEWKVVEEAKAFQAVHAKTYMSQDYTGNWHIVSNGIPHEAITPSDIRRVAAGETVEVVFPSLPRAISTIGGRPGTLRTIARTIKAVYNSDRWVNGTNGNSTETDKPPP